MKKTLAVFLVLFLVAGSIFAAEPVANVNVAEFTGDAKVTFGVDLDTGDSGFKNEANVSLKLNLLDIGEKSTAGEGIWGEIKIKTEGDSFTKYKNNDGTVIGGATTPDNGTNRPLGFQYFKLTLDTAKIHFGPVYVGIKDGDTQTGELKLQQAIQSTSYKYYDGENLNGSLNDSSNSTQLPNVGPADYKQGIVLGGDFGIVGFDVDFRSMKIGDEYWTNKYALAAEVNVKPIDNLEIKAGSSLNLATDKSTDFFSGFSASAGYKIDVNDKYYVKPQLGYTGLYSDGRTNRNNSWASVLFDNSMIIGVLFGWGEEEDANVGITYMDNRFSRKVTPGVSLQTEIPLPATGSAYIQEDGKFKKASKYITFNGSFPVTLAFFSGEIVENLTVGALIDMRIPGRVSVNTTTYDVLNTGAGTQNNKTKGPQSDFAFAAMIVGKYAIKLDGITVSPLVGLVAANRYYNRLADEARNPLFNIGNKTGVADTSEFDMMGRRKNGIFNIKAGVELAGLVSNTTFALNYTSKNLMNSTTNAQNVGLLEMSAKLAF